MGTQEKHKLGYPTKTLDAWAQRAKALAAGKAPEGLETVATSKADGAVRDVYLYVISGDKVRNPAAAKALIERTG
jgi:uncharacterized protein YecE (DUF72 family)